MIHGGPRYLTYDPDVTYTSCLDSGHIQHIAPHLLFRIPFLMPVHKSAGSKVELLGLEAERMSGAYEGWVDGFLFSLSGPIYAGTNEIQRNIIAERVLGLPRK
jgi:glycerol-3-phosphate dehydrogenase